MKVLMINGSCHENGCTYTALSKVAEVLNNHNIDTEIYQLGSQPIKDCIGCLACRNLENNCVFNNDCVNEIINKAKNAGGFIFGTPVYYAHPSGRILSALDRIFYAGGSVFAHKPAAAIASARRAGTTASLDVLNKYFTIAQMPVVSSTYWNMVHGARAEDVLKDDEGLQTMRNIGENMAWLLKCIESGKNSGVPSPNIEKKHRTNFIR